MPSVMEQAAEQDGQTDYRPPINLGLLPTARERVGLALPQAREYVNDYLRKEEEPEVTDDELTSWERGGLYPTLPQAEALARAYLIPFVALFASRLSV
jgi:hypothetical protein